MDCREYSIITQGGSTTNDKVVDKLLQRTEARIMEMEKKRLEKDSKNAITEQTEYFNSIFHASRKQIEAKLSVAWEIDKKILTCHFDEIIRDLQKLQKLLSDSILFMPAYEIKVAQESLKALQEDIQGTQNALLPKKKFTFRNKMKVHNSFNDTTVSIKQNGVSHLLEPHQSTVKQLMNSSIVWYNEDVDAKDIVLHFLTNCKVCLFGAPSTLFISGLTDCQVFTGPVSSSVHIENCSNCTFIIACQQLRIHSTSISTFYTHVTSRTIIEDCSALLFAPNTATYCGLDKDFLTAGLDKGQNNWNAVDDFNWLVSGVPSPNWSLLPEEQYVPFQLTA